MTVIKLLQLYYHFSYLLVGKLYTLLKRLSYNINKEIIKKLTKYYYYYQKYSKSLYRFKFKFPDNLDFNHIVFINIFYINGKPVLYIVNKAIGFTTTRFLKDISIKTTWEAFYTY